MIVGNVIKFGFGDIQPGAYKMMSILIFRSFVPPCGVGDVVPDDVDFLETIVIKVNYEELKQYRSLLELVKKRTDFYGLLKGNLI